MTWKEFKEYVESKGVKDNMTIDYIDISSPDLKYAAFTPEVGVEEDSFAVYT